MWPDAVNLIILCGTLLGLTENLTENDKSSTLNSQLDAENVVLQQKILSFVHKMLGLQNMGKATVRLVKENARLATRKK